MQLRLGGPGGIVVPLAETGKLKYVSNVLKENWQVAF